VVLVIAALVLVYPRLGVWWMCLLYPLAQLSVMPRQILGLSGLNPPNVLMLATVCAIVLAWAGARWRNERCQLPPAPRPLLWFYVLPIGLGMLHGIPSVPLIAEYYYQIKAVAFDSASTYARDVFVRPMLEVLFALMVAMVFRDARRPRYLLTPIVIAGWLLCGLIVMVVTLSGFDLAALSSTRNRETLSGLGMHANELSLMLNSVLAITLFSARGATGWVRLLLAVSAAMFASCVVLTFSRGGFLGLGLVFLAFMFRSASVRAWLGSLLLAALVLVLMPSAAWDRMFLGFDSGDRSAMSAGRMTDIWPHLINIFLESPLIGHGLHGILWSTPARQGVLSVAQAHNAYLGLLVELGVAGFLAVIGFHIWAWRQIRAASAAVPQAFDREMLAGCAVTVLLLFVQGMSDDRFTPTVPQTFMWFALGAGLGTRLRRHRRGGSRKRAAARQQRPALNEVGHAAR
jgi:O-antigen ligase